MEENPLRTRDFILIWAGFLVSLGCPLLAARTEEQRAPLYVFEDVVVKPFMIEEHERAIKEMAAIFLADGDPFLWYAYSTDDFHYYYVFPAANLAKIDDIISGWNRIVRVRAFQTTYEHRTSGLFRFRSDLSWIPAQREIRREDVPFLYWGFCYVRPGLEEPIEESWKTQAELFKRKGIPHSWEIYAGDIGTEMPLYIYLERASRPGSFFTDVDKLYEQAGEEFIALVEKERSCYRKLEIKTGRFRQDLSCIPPKK